MNKNILTIISLLRLYTKKHTPPLSDLVITEFGHDPFLILVSCLLSLRARDSMTIHVVRTLFSKIKTPAQLQALDIVTLEHLIKRIGFYKTKARTLHAVTEQIITSYKSKVPNSYDRLTAIKGVGPKTANLVLGIAFGQPAICVDIHVHRISNRFGLITTQSPQQTIVALENILDKKDWIEWNKLLVMWGQNVCTPISPKCNSCPLTHYCKRTGVKTHR